ncbi:MAG: hypothetical protein ACREL1_07785 [bacterium]
MAYNLDNLSFGEWIKFIFDHPSKGTKDEKAWYWLDEWKSEFKNNSLQIEYLTKLFEKPEILKNVHTREQIDQGLWFLMASGYKEVHIRDYGDGEEEIDSAEFFEKRRTEKENANKKGLKPNHGIVMLFNDPRTSWLLREKCIKLMENLYNCLFLDDPIKSASFMWWDEICYDYFMKSEETVTEDGLKVQNAMFETLKNILNSNTAYFQLCALHGLGHLRHKDTGLLISEYLNRNDGLPKAVHDYAEGCIQGTMDRIHVPYECF